MRKRFPYGKKNGNETLLKDSSYTAALLDIAEEMASSRGMSTSNTFKTLKEFKSPGKFQLQPYTPKENEHNNILFLSTSIRRTIIFFLNLSY
jgi:hypothetical protein